MHEGEDLTVRWMTFGVKELLLSFFPERGKFVSSASKNGYCTTLPLTCPSFPNVSSADKSIVASNVFSPIVSETFNLVEGIEKGDLNKASVNGGLLGLYSVTGAATNASKTSLGTASRAT